VTQVYHPVIDMPFAVGGTIDISEVRTKLVYARDQVRKKALRKGVSRGAGRILKDAKARAPIDTTTHGLAVKGLYKKSLGKVVKVYRNGMTAMAAIGPRRGFKTQVRTATRGKKKGQAVYQDPANISHLVEYGTQHARAEPHLRPAFDCNKEAVIGDIADAVREEIF